MNHVLNVGDCAPVDGIVLGPNCTIGIINDDLFYIILRTHRHKPYRIGTGRAPILRVDHYLSYAVKGKGALRTPLAATCLLVDGEGIAVQGLLIRHLVMPNDVAGTDRVMNFLANEISLGTYVNVMDQYRPCGDADADELINRRLTSEEFRRAVGAARDAGLSRLDSRERPPIIFGF